MKKLIITSDNGKLNLADLPHNCIFNKKITGCGGTTIALFNDENYIIAVPTTELIVNKTGKTESGLSDITFKGKSQTVFGLFGKFDYHTKKQIKEYSQMEGVKKIICTYDKIEALSKLIDFSEYRLLVDEYQVLLKAYSYRQKAVDGVLRHFKEAKSYCFMSATPINADFKPAILSEIEEVEAVWDEVDTLFVSLDLTNHPYQKMANIINSFINDGYKMKVNGNEVNELFVFLNSVSGIASIAKFCNLTNDNTRVICSDSDANREKLNGISISNSKSANKPINFITSKSFEGADFFSETGISFVVSNSGDIFTQLDISTDIYQIAGRIRNEDNPNRNILIHIFNTTGRNELNLDISYEDMLQLVKDEEDGALAIINTVNNNANAKKIASKMLNDGYILIDEDGRYYLNDMLIKLELFNYSVNQQIYKNGISITKAYNQNGVLTTAVEYDAIDNELEKVNKKLTFKEAFLKYAEMKSHRYSLESLDAITKVQPLVVDAYNYLGTERVKALKYIKKNVEAALINLDADRSTENKIAKLLKSEISYEFISCNELIGIFSRIFNRLGIKAAVKATAIEKYYNCKSTVKKIDGKSTKGYMIYKAKFVFGE